MSVFQFYNNSNLITYTSPRDLGAIVNIFKVPIAAFVVQSVGFSIRFDLINLYCVLPEKLFLNKFETKRNRYLRLIFFNRAFNDV